MVRRTVAFGVGLLVLVLLLFGLKGCLDSRKDRAFVDYTRDVAALIQESDQQSAALFQLLNDPGNIGDVEVTNRLNGFRVQSEQLVDRAVSTEHPEELDSSQEFLVQVLEFRRDGVRAIAEALPSAIADEGDQQPAIDTIARAMQNFLTSDVLYQTRVQPRLRRALGDQGVEGEQNVPDSQFLADISFLQPDTVSDGIQGIGGGGGGDEEAAPGLHGNGLVSASLGGQALSPDGSVSVPLSGDLTLDVEVANQGDNDETDVGVSVTIGDIEASGTLDEIAAGEQQTVSIPIDGEPPTGQNVDVTVEIDPVPGEEVTDNNTGEYTAIFTN